MEAVAAARVEAVAAARVEAVAAARVEAVLFFYEGAWCGLNRSSCQAAAKIQTGAVFWPIVYIRTFRSPFVLSPFLLTQRSVFLPSCKVQACSQPVLALAIEVVYSKPEPLSSAPWGPPVLPVSSSLQSRTIATNPRCYIERASRYRRKRVSSLSNLSNSSDLTGQNN